MNIVPNSPREKSIWGPHILWPPDRNFTGQIASAAPAAIKLVADDKDILYLDELIALNPALLGETIFIVRPFKLTKIAEAMVSAANLKTDIIAAASYLHNAILKVRDAYPRLKELPIYWEAMNETPREMMAKCAIFDRESAYMAERDDIKRLLGGFSEGTPDILDYPSPERPGNDDWSTYYPALEAIDAVTPEVAMLHTHEYVMGLDAVPDKSIYRNELLLQPWRVGRINKVYERHIRPHGWKIASVISEGPIDKPCKSGLTDEMKLAWMTDEAFEAFYVPEVKAHTVYTIDGNEYWREQGFSFVPIAKRLFNYIRTYVPPAIIEVPPDEPEEPGEPSDEVAVTTVSPTGQWIRVKPSLAADNPGDMDFGEIGYVAKEDAASIGRAYSWVWVRTSRYEGWMAAWLLIRKD